MNCEISFQKLFPILSIDLPVVTMQTGPCEGRNLGRWFQRCKQLGSCQNIHKIIFPPKHIIQLRTREMTCVTLTWRLMPIFSLSHRIGSQRRAATVSSRTELGIPTDAENLLSKMYTVHHILVHLSASLGSSSTGNGLCRPSMSAIRIA